MSRLSIAIQSMLRTIPSRKVTRDAVLAAKRQLTDRLLLVAVLLVFPCVYIFAFAYSLLRAEHLFAYTAVAEQLTIQINREVSWQLSYSESSTKAADATILAQGTELLKNVVSEVIGSSNISQRAFLEIRDSSDQLIFESAIGDKQDSATNQAAKIEVFQAQLAAPFQGHKVEFFVPEKNLLLSAMTIELLALFLLSAVVLVLYILHRSGIEQIAIIKRRSDFFKAISHELKTPLTGLRLYAELLARSAQPDPETLAKYSSRICKESQRLSHLVESILQMTAVDMRATSKPSAQSLVAALDVIKHRVAPLAELSDFKFTLIELEQAQKTKSVEFDPDALAAIFILLIENATKYVTAEYAKELVAGVRISKNKISFYLRDFGPGLLDDEVADIFSPFFRGRNNTPNSSGTGIGLAIAREIAKHIGAELSAKQMSPGAEFILTLDSNQKFSRLF